MPRSTRQEVIRKHNMVIGHMEKAILGCDELATQFQPHHPDYALGYTNIVRGLYQMLEFFKSIKNHV